MGLSSGLDFESRIYAKINAGELLKRELDKPSYQPEPIALGVITDAYQPVERNLRITRRVIEILSERVLEACAEAGATSASYYIVLRLPWEVAPLFKGWLAAHFPDRVDRVMGRARDMRGGKDYDSDFSKRMKGEEVYGPICSSSAFIRQRSSLA